MDEDQNTGDSEQPEENEELRPEDLEKVAGGVNTFGISSFTNGHCKNE